MSRHPLADLIAVQPRPNDPTGLVAIGGTITPAALLSAVSLGIFPWTGRKPIPWCSPNPRAVFHPGRLRVPRSLRKSLRNRGFRVTYDHTFETVVAACATTPRPGQPGTWMTPNLTRAWTTLHRAGFYHSVEVWLDDNLVGGLIGLAVGGVFLGDTMFHRERDASKVGFVTLCHDLHHAGYTLVDGQAPTPHLRSLGAQEVSRETYLQLLGTALAADARPVPWRDGVVAVSLPSTDSGAAHHPAEG
jgi:leucyl/phenylalanyl-tRNA--protein transferase